MNPQGQQTKSSDIVTDVKVSFIERCTRHKHYRKIVYGLLAAALTMVVVREYRLNRQVTFPPRSMETISFQRDHSWWMRNISVPRRLYNTPDRDEISLFGTRYRVFEVAVDNTVLKFRCKENERIYVETLD